MAADGGAVEYVIVDQCGRVNHLDDGGEQVMRRRDLAASESREQEQRRSETLALVMGDVTEELIDARARGIEGAAKDAFNFFQIVGNGCEETSLARLRRGQRGIHEHSIQRLGARQPGLWQRPAKRSTVSVART